MAESLISQLLKKGQEPDPLANIGQGGYGMQMPQNPIMDAANAVGEHLTPEYLKNPNIHGLAPNENWKTPRSQPDNPLPWLAPDLASAIPSGAAKVAAPFMKSMFFGPLAKTANLAKLAKAKEMAAQGAHDILNAKSPVPGVRITDFGRDIEKALPEIIEARDKNIFKETGWLRRPDSKWREYDPAPFADLTDQGMREAAVSGGTPLSKALRYKKLYDAYPDIGDIRLTSLPDNSPYSGVFNPSGVMGMKNQLNPKRTATALHETTHGIQDMTGEGFAPGSNPSDLEKLGIKVLRDKGVNVKPLIEASDRHPPELEKALSDASRRLYHRHTGEEEAYQSEHLWNLPPHLRQNAYPNEHYLIHPSKQVVPYDWLSKQTPETQQFVKNTMTHQFQGGPPTLENYIKLLMQDAK